MEFLTPNEVAALLRVDAATVRRWCQAGRLRAVRLPTGGYRIPRSAVDQIRLVGEVPHA
jgi:excisionase family DNA binding protein